jgi:hypothetical protein
MTVHHALALHLNPNLPPPPLDLLRHLATRAA